MKAATFEKYGAPDTVQINEIDKPTPKDREVLVGCHAKYITISEDRTIVKMPKHLPYEEAAALPFGALSSLYFLRALGKIKSKEKILINGASGSLVVYAVQLAKYFGAEVTAVCSNSNLALVKSLGLVMQLTTTQKILRKAMCFTTSSMIRWGKSHSLKANVS